MPHIDKWKIKKGTKFPVDKDAKSRSQIEDELLEEIAKDLRVDEDGTLQKFTKSKAKIELREMTWEKLVKLATKWNISIYKSQKKESEGPKRNPYRRDGKLF